MLINKTYIPSELTTFKRRDGLSNKERLISRTKFYPDQIIHHALIQVISPIIKRGMYKYCCANIPKRGPVYAKRACEKFIRNDPINTKYCLKMDVKQFYPSIRLDVLKTKLRRVIKDNETLWLLDSIIDSGNGGLPIGSYTSQWLANFYLQDLDHFIKEKCQAKYLIRYADDIVVLGPNKRKLRKIKYKITSFFELKIKDNWRVFEITNSQCLDFVGYKMYREKTAIRKRIFRRLRRVMLKIKYQIDNHIKVITKLVRSFFAYYGYVKNSDSYFIQHTYLKDLNLFRLKLCLH